MYSDNCNMFYCDIVLTRTKQERDTLVCCYANKDKHNAALSFLQAAVHGSTVHYTTLQFKANRHCSFPIEKIIFICVQRDYEVHKYQ